MEVKQKDIDRFWSKVEKTDSCWNWKGAIRCDGYGKFKINRKTSYAHRFSYELSGGNIPSTLQLDHLCRNRACVNPEHLETVTGKENMARGSRKTKKYCPRGHEYNAENTYIYKDERSCRVCHRLLAHRRLELYRDDINQKKRLYYSRNKNHINQQKRERRKQQKLARIHFHTM